MNWINEFVTPKIKAIIGTSRSDKNDDVLWTKCPKCEHMLYNEDLAANYMVCGYCGFHFRLNANDRAKLIFGTQYTVIDTVSVKDDPLKFKDTKKYSDRLKDARRKTSMHDASFIASGDISEQRVIFFSMNFDFMGGSMGLAVGKSFEKAVNIAIEDNAVMIACPASGGARMQEGMYSLMQMAVTAAAVSKLKASRIPFINILTHPTTGGVLASFAMLGDINIAEPGATIGFAGARVIEKTMKQKLPDEFQTAEFLQDRGMVDLISPRKDIQKTLATIVSHLCMYKPNIQ